MPARVRVLAGPARSGKTRAVLARYREALGRREPGAMLWLAPNRRAAIDVQGRLVDGSMAACLAPGVTTFAGFAEAVVQFSPEPVRLLDSAMKRHLVRGLLDEHHEAGRLKYFGPIAGTGGLADLVVEWITELKRLEIWPEDFRKACEARGMTAKDAELLALYEDYQARLVEHHLYDAEGRFWSARTLLARGQTRPFERLRLVVADGFTDFTRTQHEILEVLADRVEEVVITLPLEPQTERPDLFARPQRTLDALHGRHEQMAVQWRAPSKKAAWPAMAHLQAHLFGNPRRYRPLDEPARRIEILAASRELGEIELIAGRIKGLLTEGCEESDGRPVRPGDVAVVFRSPSAAEPLAREVFGRLGIPVWVESSPPLLRSRALAALVSLVQLSLEDWPFRQLLTVLAGSYFQPDWPEWQEGRAVLSAQRLIRRLQIPRGREGLLGRLRWLAERAPGPSADEEEDEGRAAGRGPADDARTALALLSRLGQALDALPRRAPLGAWADAWRRLAEDTGLLRAIPGAAEGRDRAGLAHGTHVDALAWQRLEASLRAADRLAEWLGRPAPPLERRAALAELLDVLATTDLGPPGDETGRVRVLSARSARAIEVPYLFLAGLSEKAFPPPQREDRLYGEAEAQRLIAEGLPLVARSDRNREEMLLFYEAVTRATRRLTLSYPALDESAQPLAASPYLKEIEAACGPGRIPREEVIELSPVPRSDEPRSAADFRVKAVADALAGNVALLAGLVRAEPSPGLAENLLAALRMAASRGRREAFGPAEGMLQGEAARAEMAVRFAHDRTFTATELERYAACPYRFFLERLLRLEPLEDLTLAVDFLERGRLAHEVLARLHAEINREAGRPASPCILDEETFRRRLVETMDQVLAAPEAPSVAAAMREVDRRVLTRWLGAYRHQHARYDAEWKDLDEPPLPTCFEVSFGSPGAPSGQTALDEPLALSSPHGTVRLAGRFDRVDVGKAAGRTVFNVLDYKTGGAAAPSREAVEAGTALQLPLYALAVERLLLAAEKALPWRAGYWHVKDAGFKPKQALKMHEAPGGDVVPAEGWEEIQALAASTAALLANALRRAEFPVHSRHDECTAHCPYSRVCRIAQVRWLEKEWRAEPEEEP